MSTDDASPIPSSLLERLSAYVLADDDIEENLCIAVGAAAVLRTLRHGVIDADLANLIAIIDDFDSRK